MYYGMYVAAMGAHAQGERMEVISHNIANAGTSGFKRELALMQARHAESIERGEASPGMGTINDVGGGLRLTKTVTDFSLGPLRDTGVDTDFALSEPDHFFAVEKDGKEYLTRSGNFQFRTDGTLITAQGFPVLGADGEPVRIDPQIPFTVSPSGEFQQGGEKRGLSIKRPESLGDLVRAGENLFESIGDEATAVPAEKRNVLWQHLEASAVQPHAEMIQMIETSRAYEANVRMIQNHDTVLGGLIGRLLRA